MAHIDLSQVPLADLIAELLLDGRSGHSPDLLPFEPISVTGILAELHRRTGQEIGANMYHWRDWFLNACANATLFDRCAVEIASIRLRIRERERRARRKLARRATSAPADPET